MSEYWESLTVWKKTRLVLIVILSIFMLTFAIVNWQESVVNFIFFRLKISITLLIIVCVCVGYLISTVFEYRHYSEKVKEIALLNAEIDRLNAVISNAEAPGQAPETDVAEVHI